MTDNSSSIVSENKVIDVNISFPEYIKKEAPSVTVKGWSPNWYVYEVRKDYKTEVISTWRWKPKYRHFPIPFKIVTEESLVQKEFESAEILICKVLPDLTNKGLHITVDVYVYEGDEKEYWEAFYERIKEYATQYAKRYNQHIAGWVTFTFVKHISLKMKKADGTYDPYKSDLSDDELELPDWLG